MAAAQAPVPQASFSAAALPHPHFQVVFLQNLHGLQIEPGGPGNFGGGLGQRKMLYVRAEQHPMGIADRKPGQGFPLPPTPAPERGEGRPITTVTAFWGPFHKMRSPAAVWMRRGSWQAQPQSQA